MSQRRSSFHSPTRVVLRNARNPRANKAGYG